MEIIGVDTGGTFTDFIYKSNGKWGVYKILSSPANPADSLLKGLEHAVSSKEFKIIHGSTVATNAILERKGAKCALITNKGFEDIIEIGRQNRSELYNLSYRKEPVLVPDKLRFGVKCRVNFEGKIIDEIDESSLNEIIKNLKKEQIESIAVCFLFSYLNPKHELAIQKALEKLQIPISLSHRIVAEFREYERTSTTIINAYVSPKMKRYIKCIIDDIGNNELRIMQSNGGSISADVAMNESVRTIISGPAGGAVGAYELGKMAGYNKLITFDMGGTSTDVCLIDGNLPLSFESRISELPVKVPMIDIHTVGAGGGSIAYRDLGESLCVGPESAGADPGPICYGKGERITVTDANLFLGRLVPDYFLGGNMQLGTDKLDHYFEEMAKEVGLSALELAEGVLSVANASMEKAIRVISVEKGFDPREFTLFSFGGAGGMHAVFLARLLHIPTVLVPKNPGILSAIGMLMADIIKDYSLTVMMQGKDTNTNRLKKIFEPLEKEAVNDLTKEGIRHNKMHLERYLDMRYVGQSYEITVPFDENYIDSFHKSHKKNYGYANRRKEVEIVNIRLRGRGIPEKPVFEKNRIVIGDIDPKAIIGKKKVIFDSQSVATDILLRDKLLSGNIIKGPAIILEYSSTIVLPPDSSAKVDEFGNLIINVQGAKSEG